MTRNFEPLKLFIPASHSFLEEAFKYIPGMEASQNTKNDCVLKDEGMYFSLSVNPSLHSDLKKPTRLGQIADEVQRLTDQQAQSLRDQPVQLGNAVFDPRNMTWRQSENIIELTEKEVAVIQNLLSAAPYAISRDDLLQSVWGYHPDVTTHTVETHLWRLRQKIERDPSAPEIIITTPEGYAFGVEVKGEK